MSLWIVVCLLCLFYLAGSAALWLLRENTTPGNHFGDSILTGGIVCTGAVEAVHLTVLFLGRSFFDAVKLSAALFSLLALFSLCLLGYGYCRNRKNAGRHRGRGRRPSVHRRDGRPYTVLQTVLCIVFILIAVYQILVITRSEMVYTKGDITAETVGTILDTNTFYQINPMTGRAYEEGAPLRLKILCLPTFYAVLCRIFGAESAEVVWRLAPLMTLFGSYLAFYILAEILFPEEDREKREIFMVLVALIFCTGNLYGVEGVGLLYSGFRGVVIRNTVLVPYTLGLCLRRRYKPVILCVLAEACIVWTLYGLGICLLTALLAASAGRLWEKFCRMRPDVGEGS